MTRAIHDALSRINAMLKEIRRLKESEFPYDHSLEALKELEEMLTQQKNKIEKEDDREIIREYCCASFNQLYGVTPYLGIILRSTNIRNSFESYWPLLRLVQKVLNNTNKKLILSSEWDYSPFVYPNPNYLPDYVIIGLPAFETSNPLLIPLAGHELGHALFRQLDATSRKKLRQDIEDHIINKLVTPSNQEKMRRLYPQFGHITSAEALRENTNAYDIWNLPVEWARGQVEETFSDICGVRLFAESYLHAFCYLVSPGALSRRNTYPKLPTRINKIIQSATHFGVEIPDNYADNFGDGKPTEKNSDDDISQEQFLLQIADETSESLFEDLLAKVDGSLPCSRVSYRNKGNVDKILSSFKKLLSPFDEYSSLTDLLTAGWTAYLDDHLWSHLSYINKKEWNGILNDLIFKSMEVSEYELLINEIGGVK